MAEESRGGYCEAIGLFLLLLLVVLTIQHFLVAICVDCS